MFALDGLRVLFANGMLLGGEMPLVGLPPIRVKLRDTKRLSEPFQWENHLIFALPKDIRQYGATVVNNGVPQPAWLRFRAHRALHLIEL